MSLTIALTLLAAQAPAPPSSAPTEADIEAVMQRALAPHFEAFGTCVSTGLESAPRRGPVSRAAAAIVRNCRPQQQALFAAYERFIAEAPLDEAQKTQSRTAWQESQRTLPSQIEAALTQSREAEREED
jgi:hypothetical protein